MIKEGIPIYKARGPLYFHFSFVMVIFYSIFWDLKSELFWLILGSIIIIIGELIRLWGASYIGTCGRKFNLDVQELSTTGPYFFVRNPIYLGNFVWALGFTVLTKLWFLLPYFYAWLIILYWFIIPSEEKYLSEKFGEQYKDYCKKVHRIIPRFRFNKNNEKAEYNILKGLKNETHVIIYHIGTMIIFYTFSYIRGGFVWF